jgi:Sulfotransferase family
VIVSHEHRFIFIKTRKTAGTSVEVFLAQHAEPGAICTPVVPPVPGHEPRHYRRFYNPVPEMRRINKYQRPLKHALGRHAFYPHIDAQRVRERLGARIFDSYFKFCFERDPWDKVVSQYYFRRTRTDVDTPPSFGEFVMQGPLVSDWSLYSIGGSPVMDFIGRFEDLDADLTQALGSVGIDATVTLTKEKGASRPREGGDAVYTPELDARVAKVFAREIRHFGYPDRSLPSTTAG